jgi:class 3 adenylate cyclase
MAILGADSTDAEAADAALDTALTIFYVLQNLVNPYLASIGIARVDARIGIDLGRLLLARIGIPSGSARHQSNFLTAVGPAANLACRLQQMADTNQIWVGDLIKRSATGRFDWLFREVTPSDWTWVYDHNRARYPAWHYNDSRSWPDLSLGELLRGLYRT